MAKTIIFVTSVNNLQDGLIFNNIKSNLIFSGTEAENYFSRFNFLTSSKFPALSI